MKFETENHASNLKLVNQLKSFAITPNAAFQDNMLVMVITIAEISATKRQNCVQMDKNVIILNKKFCFIWKRSLQNFQF